MNHMIISPIPQRMEKLNGEFLLNNGPLTLVLNDGGNAYLNRTAEDVCALINKITGIKSEVTRMSIPGRYELSLTKSATPCAGMDLNTDNSEGYSLRIDADNIVLCGVDAAGLFYAMRSLLVLLESGNDTLKCMNIVDWPDFRWRGYGSFFGGHHYHQDSVNPERYRAIVTDMAAAKLNRICFESEAFASDEDLQEFGEFCRQYFIEPIPLHPFLCLEHQDVVKYVRATDNEFAEMMQPADRAIHLLKPEFVGIAGDELISDYDHVNRASIYSAEDLGERPAHEWLALCVTRFRDYFAKQGVRITMWADTLLDPDQFWGRGCEMKDFNGGVPDYHAPAIDALPKDILLWDWQYIVNRDYASMDYLLSKGFEVVGGAILTGLSEKAFTEYAHKIKGDKLLGMMSLTWCSDDLGQYHDSANLLAAGDCYWSVGEYAIMPPGLENLRKLLNTPNPFMTIPSDESEISVSGDGHNFAIYSAGRIYCLIMPDGLGTWPMKELSSDLRFIFKCRNGGAFSKCVLKLKLAGETVSSLYLSLNPEASRNEFKPLGEVPIGDTNVTIDISDNVTGNNEFALWIRAGKNQETKHYLRKLTVCSKT